MTKSDLETIKALILFVVSAIGLLFIAAFYFSFLCIRDFLFSIFED